MKLKREKIIAVKLSAVERNALDQMAKAWGTSRADVIRWGLRTVLKENQQPGQNVGH